MRSARTTSRMSVIAPATSSPIAGGDFGAGTGGTIAGSISAEAPSASTPKKSTTCRTTSGLTLRVRRSAGSAVSASRYAPTGIDRPPASAITPFGPTIIPGVESPWTANRAVMVENAVPISTARPSRARAPAIVSASEAKLVIEAAPPTRPKCSCIGIITGCEPMIATTGWGSPRRRAQHARPGHARGIGQDRGLLSALRHSRRAFNGEARRRGRARRRDPDAGRRGAPRRHDHPRRPAAERQRHRRSRLRRPPRQRLRRRRLPHGRPRRLRPRAGGDPGHRHDDVPADVHQRARGHVARRSRRAPGTTSPRTSRVRSSRRAGSAPTNQSTAPTRTSRG